MRSQALERGVRALRFLEEVDRSELERAKNVLFRRQAGYHDDGKRMPVHQQLEELEPIEARHLQVQRDEIRRVRLDDPKGIRAVARDIHM